MRKLKSGVYFVSPSQCESFIEHARTSGWSPKVEPLRRRWENKNDEYYVVFSLDSDKLDSDKQRVGTWGYGYAIEDYETWDDWCFTDKYIEIYQPYRSDILY